MLQATIILLKEVCDLWNVVWATHMPACLIKHVRSSLSVNPDPKMPRMPHILLERYGVGRCVVSRDRLCHLG